MGRSILQHGGKYLLWSSVTDSPVTGPMTRQELEEQIRFENGQRGMDDLPARVARADSKGTSMMRDSSLQDTVAGNRAGWRELNLTLEQVIQIFFVEGREATQADGGRVWDPDADQLVDYHTPRGQQLFKG